MLGDHQLLESVYDMQTLPLPEMLPLGPLFH